MQKNRYETIITTFEAVVPDIDIPETKGVKQIAVIRDIDNLLASRYKKRYSQDRRRYYTQMETFCRM